MLAAVQKDMQTMDANIETYADQTSNEEQPIHCEDPEIREEGELVGDGNQEEFKANEENEEEGLLK